MKKIFILILLSFSISLLFSQNPDNEKADEAIKQNTNIILDNIDILEVFGPVLPIALSPFFGVAITSLASIMAAEGVFKNEFLATHPILSNWWIMSIFLILTILTALPKYTKITGQLGLFIAKIEDYAGLIILVIIQIVPSLFNSEPSDNITVIYNSRFIEVSYGTLIAAASVANMYVIKVVRYFFDFLIFLSPIPSIDSIFDTIKKSSIILLIGLYVINPLLAFFVNLFVFILSAIMFGWINRRVVYFENIYINPLKIKIYKKPPSLIDEHLPQKIAKNHEFIQFAIKAFPLKRMGTFKRKMKCWLISDNNSLFLYENRFLLKPRVLDLNKGNYQLNIGQDIFWFRIEEAQKYYKLKLDISNQYKSYYEEIKNIGNFNDLGDIGAKNLLKKTKNAVKDKTAKLYNKMKQLGRNNNQNPIIDKL